MVSDESGAFIRNIAEVPWREFPNHFGGALSKPLVMPETAGSRHIDYRISMYQPMAHVARHTHKIQEQIYHVLEGEGLMEIAGKNQIVRKHDFIFLPPGVEHAISNSGLTDLVFLVITSPVTDSTAVKVSSCIVPASVCGSGTTYLPLAIAKTWPLTVTRSPSEPSPPLPE